MFQHTALSPLVWSLIGQKLEIEHRDYSKGERENMMLGDFHLPGYRWVDNNATPATNVFSSESPHLELLDVSTVFSTDPLLHDLDESTTFTGQQFIKCKFFLITINTKYGFRLWNSIHVSRSHVPITGKRTLANIKISFNTTFRV